MYRLWVGLLFLLISYPVSAQWQIQNNAIPFGKGSGKVGFGAIAGAGNSTQCLIDSVPPTFGPCPAIGVSVACTGSGDDSVIINSAITSAVRGYVNLISPTCTITNSINLKQGIILRGINSGLTYGLIGVTTPTPNPTKILWTGGATGAMISTPSSVLNTDMGIENLLLDGQVANGSLSTSALKGIKLGPTINTKFNGVGLQRLGTGISFEPGFSTASPPLISWSTFRNIQMLSVGTGLDFSADATLPLIAGGVTNNFFYDLVIYNYINYGLNFRALADDNRFHGAYITTAVVGSTAIAFNTLDPTNAAGVYANSMINFEVECNTVGSGVGINSIIANNMHANFTTTFHGVLGNCNEQPVFNAGSNLMVYDESSASDIAKIWRPNAGALRLHIINNKVSAAATTGILFGNDVDSTLAFFSLNSSTNVSLGGASSINIANASTAPVAISVNGTTRNKTTNTGVEITGTLTANGNAGLTTTVVVPCGTLTFTTGLLTNKGAC